MITLNTLPGYNAALDPEDSTTLGMEAAREVQRFLSCRPDHRQTPLRRLDGLAGELGVEAIFLKDEGLRLGLGSFKALGGSYAVIRMVLEEAGRRLGHPQDIADLNSPQVREIAGQMTFGCATDGNHGKSVAMGARMVGARAAIFVHAGVSAERVAAIAACGAEIIRVEGTYDDSVAKAARVCEQNGWIVVSDTSWPGYERIPSLVMQGYTAMLGEALEALPQRPTHVFVQAGVGGLAAAVAGHFAIVFGADRPKLIIVEPARAACIHESSRAGRLVKTPHGEPTIMAMLECYEPSLVAWRILSRKADAFMTVDEDDAAATMLRLARPAAPDPAIVAGESGCAGLAGLIRAASDPEGRKMLGLDENALVLAINTETATDKGRYEAIVGMAPEDVAQIA
jgi:diaminopropionate ammonia-lyase